MKAGQSRTAKSGVSDDLTWQLRAACRGPQSRVFFPPPHFERKEEKRDREARAKAICVECPVRDSCLTHAMNVREQHGIWGGLNELERRHRAAAAN